jgi:hypothetical protein
MWQRGKGYVHVSTDNRQRQRQRQRRQQQNCQNENEIEEINACEEKQPDRRNMAKMSKFGDVPTQNVTGLPTNWWTRVN